MKWHNHNDRDQIMVARLQVWLVSHNIDGTVPMIMNLCNLEDFSIQSTFNNCWSINKVFIEVNSILLMSIYLVYLCVMVMNIFSPGKLDKAFRGTLFYFCKCFWIYSCIDTWTTKLQNNLYIHLVYGKGFIQNHEWTAKSITW